MRYLSFLHLPRCCSGCCPCCPGCAVQGALSRTRVKVLSTLRVLFVGRVLSGVAQNAALNVTVGLGTDMPTFVEPHAEPFLEFRQLIQREWTCRGVLNFCDREVLDFLIWLKMLKTIHHTHHKSIAYHSTLAVSEASLIDNNYICTMYLARVVSSCPQVLEKALILWCLTCGGTSS